jgi:hypothetical protein
MVGEVGDINTAKPVEEEAGGCMLGFTAVTASQVEQDDSLGMQGDDSAMRRPRMVEIAEVREAAVRLIL